MNHTPTAKSPAAAAQEPHSAKEMPTTKHNPTPIHLSIGLARRGISAHTLKSNFTLLDAEGPFHIKLSWRISTD